MTMTGAELLVEALARRGVRHAFGIPGDEVFLFDALRRSGIEFIVARHEQGAAFMADAYARVSGRPGVCFATLGPGATNLVTGIANAYLDRSPVISFADQVPTDQLRDGVHQYLDLDALFGPITKWRTTVTDGRSLDHVVEHAFATALAERPGPVHVTLPADVLARPVDEAAGDDYWQPPATRPAQRTAALNGSLHDLLDHLTGAVAPLAIVGPYPTRVGANAALRQLLEAFQIPVFTTYMGKGAIAEDHPLSLGVLSRHAGPALGAIFEPVDLVLTIGFDSVEGVKPALWQVGRPKHTIALDSVIDGGTGAGSAAHVVDDFSRFVDDLLALRNGHIRRSCWLDTARVRTQLRQSLRAPSSGVVGAMRPQDAVDTLRAVTAPSTIVVADVGLNKYAVGLCLETIEPGTAIFPNGLSALGFALPGAIGAKLARPQAHVIAVAGDGGFLMNVQELETIARCGLPIVVVVFRDDSFGLIKRLQETRFGCSHGVDLGNPDLPALARAFGLNGVRVSQPADLADALTTALIAERATIIDVPVCYDNWLR